MLPFTLLLFFKAWAMLFFIQLLNWTMIERFVHLRSYHGDPVLNPLTPWDRPPIKNVFCIYGIDSKTEVLLCALHQKISDWYDWINVMLLLTALEISYDTDDFNVLDLLVGLDIYISMIDTIFLKLVDNGVCLRINHSFLFSFINFIL